MRLKIRRKDDYMIIFIEGALNLHNTEKFMEYFDNIRLPESNIVVLNMKALGQVDSTGVGALIRVAQNMKEKEVRFHIAAIPPSPRKIIEEAGLISYLPVLSDEEYSLSFHIEGSH